MEQFVNGGKNLVLYSQNTGNGKTSWAIKLMLNYFSSIWNGNGFRTRGIFIHIPTYIIQKKNSFSEADEEFRELEKKLSLVDLLILDDLGTNKMTEFDISLLTSIIDCRIINGKSTIVTTNCSKQELTKVLGARIADRIYNTAATVTFKSTSKR
ncbi:MAG: ATP-binding protein [Bacteroidales bacterium]|nr:ATP-binding protein [Bacteroidales bacterium]